MAQSKTFHCTTVCTQEFQILKQLLSCNASNAARDSSMAAIFKHNQETLILTKIYQSLEGFRGHLRILE